MKKIKWGITLGLLLCVGILGIKKVGAAENWVIDNFVAEIEINKNTAVKVKETISVDFGNLQKHGIYRTIPVKYKDRYGNNLDIRFKLLAVTNGQGQAINHSQSREGNNIKIKIGDAERTISGKQTYVISYQARRVITQPNQDAEFYWNVTGNGWEVPILMASAIVKVPSGSVKDTICFSGEYGSTEQQCGHNYQEDTAKFIANEVLMPGAGLTIGVAMDPKALVLPSTIQRMMWFLQDNWLFGVPLLVLLLMLRIYWLKGRDKQYKDLFNKSGETETVPIGEKLYVPAIYAPLTGIGPGEAGVIVDERADMQDITAVIIDLAQRGFFNIREIGKKGLFSKVKYELIWNSIDESGLKLYETSVLDMLFGTGREANVMMNDLPKKAYQYLEEAKKNLYEYLVKQDYFVGNPDSVRKMFLILGMAVGVTGTALSGAGALTGSVMGWFFAALVSGLIIVVFSFFMPARTAKGRRSLAEVVGMKEWVRIGAWREQIHEKHNFFEEVLPFAIAFNLTGKFIKAFSQTDIKDLSWYQSNGAFNAIYFANSMNSFGPTVSSSVAATMPKSASSGGSAFGGGGSSGGGFGGGGGGSW